MDLDWPIALAILLIFISIAFGIYGDIVAVRDVSLAKIAEDVNQKIVDFMKVTVYEIPVNYTATTVDSSKVLYLDFVWPEGTKNSTKLFQSGVRQPCTISGARTYWLTSVTNTSPNYFRMRITSQPQSQNCSGSFTTDNASQTIPHAMEKLTMITNQKISEVTAKSYADFKSNISVSRDFRVVFNVSGTITNYGPSLPPASDVSSKETVTKVEDTDQNAVITVFVW